MKRLKWTLGILFLWISLIYSIKAHAQTTEERFHDIFLTAGYSTAFGAALGAATLSFFDDEPAKHLRTVAIGASLGFIGGSIFGSYIVFSPMFTTVENKSQKTEDEMLVGASLPRKGLVLMPNYDTDDRKLKSIAGAMTLASF